MMANSSQLVRRDNSCLRRRRSVTAGAGVKHRLNCLSALSALHSSGVPSGRKKTSVSVTMSKPVRTVTKKKQDNYVIKLGNQQFMQQFTKTGNSVVLQDQDTEVQSLTWQQKMKLFFVVMMIPSAFVVFYGGDKFNNKSSITIDPNVQLFGAMGGMGGLAQMAQMAGLPGFGGAGGAGGGGGFNGFHGHNGMGRSPYDRMRRDYDHDHDHDESIDDHRLGLRDRGRHSHRRSERNSQRDRPRHERPPPSRDNEWHDLHVPDFNPDNTDAHSEDEMMRRALESGVKEESVDNTKDNKMNDKNQMQSPQTTEKRGSSPAGAPDMKDNPHKISDNTPTHPNIAPVNPIPKNENKVILLWSPIDGLIANGNQAFVGSNCMISKCILTTDRSQSTGSDAIVFDARHLTSGTMPTVRPEHQIWIFFSNESPESIRTNELSINSLVNSFNWSWTYRSDSDIVHNSEVVRQTNGKTNQLFRASDIFYIWKQKTRMIAWFGNRCLSDSPTDPYINQLKNSIDVDDKCSDQLKDVNIDDETAFKGVADKYLFATVFENDYCKDIAIRRLHKYLKHNMIPIVRDADLYSQSVPPNAVIDAKQFASAQDLADYVLDVGSDFQKYKKLLEWKQSYEIVEERRDLCQLCYKLHDHSYQRSVADVTKWWSERDRC